MKTICFFGIDASDSQTCEISTRKGLESALKMQIRKMSRFSQPHEPSARVIIQPANMFRNSIQACCDTRTFCSLRKMRSQFTKHIRLLHVQIGGWGSSLLFTKTAGCSTIGPTPLDPVPTLLDQALVHPQSSPLSDSMFWCACCLPKLHSIISHRIHNKDEILNLQR